ncbi:hypothetical protein BvCmsNSNP003_01163 [Escherichia coli]|nr:hypothetical protein BvCmsNSNP003_01163 [Escherichia coli]
MLFYLLHLRQTPHYMAESYTSAPLAVNLVMLLNMWLQL